MDAKTLKTYQFLLKPHYLCNILLASSFFIIKNVYLICDYLFGSCAYEMRELELITFLGCVLALKTKKQRHSFKDYVATLCTFTKILSVLLYGRYNVLYSAVYVIFCIVHMIFLPAPADYLGPDSLTYFRGPNLEQELERDKRITWLIAFYASWSPDCVKLAEEFAKISYDYNLPNLKFGKIDASKYQDVARQYKVDPSSWSKQLPTVILFENGKEKMRRPYVDYKGTVQKFFFSGKNLKEHFDLNELYRKCKAHPIKKVVISDGDKKEN
ncbi:thioredoxin-related transmembrane protein 2 homolog [Watersipora subatra]|uniref:thioredoxin-related transmembrane protein 2 homolog n=1 Tax=Watersipora subatra TaxID=2589382 RepID=UPI00355B7F07